jgi:chromate reductase
MKTLLAVSGSNRSDSKNSKILRILKDEYAGKVHVEIFDAIDTLPHFNPDIEFNPNDSLFKWRKALIQADAILISTPEYAHGIPGSLKNALDWIVGSGELMDKKIGLLFTSSSEAMFVQVQLLEVLKTMSARVSSEWSFKTSGVEITPEVKSIIEKLLI